MTHGRFELRNLRTAWPYVSKCRTEDNDRPGGQSCGRRRAAIAAYRSKRGGHLSRPRAGDATPEALLLFVAPSALYCSRPDRCDAPDANLGDVAFFDKADDTASRGLRRYMTDVFASVGGVARLSSNARSKLSFWRIASSVAPLPAPIACSNDAPRTQSLG